MSTPMDIIPARDIRLQWAAFASIGAGVIHGAAIGMHADHPTLSRIFLAFTVTQVCWGVLAMTRSSRLTALVGLAINGAAVMGWLLTRTVGIGFVSGLETAENPQPADTLCALLAGISLLAVGWAWLQRDKPVSVVAPLNALYACGGITIFALWGITGNAHGHDASHDQLALTPSDLVITNDGVIVSANGVAETSQDSVSRDTVAASATPDTNQSSPTSRAPASTILPSGTTTTSIHPHTVTRDQALAAASGWPRPFDPAVPVDFTGIGGVTAEQAARATALIQSASRDLAKYASVSAASADGYFSIGDGATGFEHYIKYSLMGDGRVLDTSAPESLVYSTAGGSKTLVSAMFFANPGTLITDATLNNYAGGLMQWHVHTNLCWANVGGTPKVVGVTNAAGNCAIGAPQTGGAPMVHVWITPHKCGPFAALEGVGAGVADVSDSERVDLCNKAH